jgi:2-polyprenyl-3-methyl-5-hydroxy-6-metoxy-1,4-benzoquinol methylase
VSDKETLLNQIAKSYDPSDPTNHFDYWFKRFEAKAFFEWASGSRCLELGGATGESSILLSQESDRYVIVEGSEVNIQTLRARVPHCEIVHAYWEEFSTNEQFSDIILFETLEHYEDPVSLLKRCKGWLQDQGRIHVSVPNGLSLHRQVAVRMGLMESPTALNEADVAQGHLRNYTVEQLEADVFDAGLTCVHQQGLFLKVVPNSMMLTWNPKLLWAINDLAKDRPHEAAEIYMVLEVA